MRKALQKVLDKGDALGSGRDRAWIYRSALDRVYNSVGD